MDSLVGFVVLIKLSINFPFSSTKNLVKFHRILVFFTPLRSFSVRYLKIGAISSPLTETFAAIGKVTPKFF